MGTAGSIQNYFGPRAVDNENTLITDYWLEFVAATDDRENPPSRNHPGAELRGKVQVFTQRMNTLIEGQDQLRKSLQKGTPELQIQRSPNFPSPQGSTSSTDCPVSSPALSSSENPELTEMTGPFARGKHFVSNCLRDGFILEVLDKSKL